MATFNFNVHPDNNLALHFADEAVSGGFNVDLSLLGLDDDDDQHVPAPATQPLFAENLIASLQRSQSKPSAMPTQDNNDMMRLFGPLSQAPSNKHGSGSFSANAPVTLTQIDPARASATTKALQALQARSRHPQAAADLADPNRGIAVDSSLFGSLPADIGSLDCTVYVQYLPVTMKEIEFMELICQHGAPKRVRICGNPKKEHNWTYGFVEYGSPEEAAKFIRECDGIRAGPFRMRCNIAKTPIVDRLAIDAPPDGRCTFAQKFPNRTLRELILASISVTDDQNNGGVIITGGRDHHQAAPPPSQQPTVSERSRSDPPSEASVTSAASATHALSMPSEVALQLTGAIKDALRFLTDRNQSHFFAAKGAVQQCLEQAKRRAENLPPQLQIATLLNGTDTVFLCRLVLTALHILHGSYEDALRYALSALQAVPTPVAIVTYLNTLESAADGRTPFPRGLTPLMLNHLVCFGLLLEPVSVVAARAFFHMAKHRAAMHGYAANNALNVIVTSDLIPLARGGASLIRTLFPLLHTQQGGFPGYFFASMSTQFTPEQSCASLFSYPVPAAGTSEPATPSVVVGSVVTMNTRSAW